MEELIYYDNQIEIIKLKNNLMCSNYYSYSNISSKDISDMIRQIINEEKGKIFEENIRESLQFKLNWINGEIPRKFSYREILTKDKKYIVISNKPIIIKFDNDSYLFSMIDNDTLEVKNLNGKEKIINISKNEQKTLTYNKNTRIFISCSKNIEMDGFFCINNFALDNFDRNEIVILHNGMGNDDISSYDYAILEIKLSENKIKEIIHQLKRDKDVCETILNKKILLLGFINSKSLETDISKEVSDLKCIIFGLKNSNLFGKDVSKCLDWNLTKDVADLNQKYDSLNQILNQQYGELNKKYDDLDKKIKNINQKIDLLISFNNQTQNKSVIKVDLIGNKRKSPDK